MATKSWLGSLAAEAISRSVPKSINYDPSTIFADINDSLDLLESYFSGIHDQVPVAELEIKLMFFETLKKQLAHNLEKEINSQVIEDSELERAVDRFTKIVYVDTKNWSQSIQNLHSHVKLRIQGNQKFFSAKDNFQFQVDNLKEFALNILYLPDRDYLINGLDPLVFLKSVPDPFVVEKLVAESALEDVLPSFLNEIVEKSVEEVQIEAKKTRHRSGDTSFLDGVCGQSCVLV